MPTQPHPTTQTTINNRYTITESLGKGGMGDVFLVLDKLFNNRPLALKQITSALQSEKALTVFKREFDVMSRLRHPNLTQVFDFQTDSATNQHFITMEYIEGTSLKDHIEKKKRFSDREIITMMVDLCRVLDYIHSRSIIHKDITPGNIMLTESGVKLMDFGIADSTTQSETATGTLSYMAPEILTGTSSSVVDFFSMGCTFFELITGSSIYGSLPAQSIVHTLKNREKYEQLITAALNTIDHKQVRGILKKTLAFDPLKRYTSGAVLIVSCNRLSSQSYAIETESTKEAYLCSTEFIGREEEFRIVIDRISDKDTTPMHPLLVHGDPGIGKSRLFAEVRKYCQLQNVPFYEGSCYKDNKSRFFPFLSIMSSVLFTVDQDILHTFGPDLKKIMPFHPRLENLTAKPLLEPKSEYALQIRVMTQLLIAHARQIDQKVVLYLNDIQWIDEGSLDVVDYVFTQLNQQSSERKKISLVVYLSSRPAGRILVQDIQKKDRTDKISIDELELLPFSEEIIETFIWATFGKDNVHTSVKDSVSLIYQKVGGNPFFIQELFRYLVRENYLDRSDGLWRLEKPLQEIGIPTSIEEIIADRLQKIHLSSESLSILQVLSLVSRSLTFDELQGILPITHTTVEQLLYHELVLCTIKDDDTQYTLFHDLLRSAVIKTIDDPKLLHQKIGEGFERFYHQCPESVIDDLAHHFYSAQDTQKAITYTEKALHQALRDINQEIFFSHYTIVKTLYQPHEQEKRLTVKLECGQLLYVTGKFESARSVYKEIMDDADKYGLAVLKAMAFEKFIYLNVEARVKEQNFENVQLLIDESVVTLSKAKKFRELSHLYSTLGNYYSKTVINYQKALEYHELGIKAGEKAEDIQGICFNIGNLAILNMKLGKLDKAKDLFKKCNKIFQDDVENKHALMVGYGYLANTHIMLKEYSQALENINKLDALAQKLQNKEHAIYSSLWKTIVFCEQSKFKEAALYLAEGNAYLEEIEDQSFKEAYNYFFSLSQFIIEYGNGNTDKAIQGMQQLGEKISDTGQHKCEVYYELWRMTRSDEHREKVMQLYNKFDQDKINYELKIKIEQVQADHLDYDIYHKTRSNEENKSQKEEIESFNIQPLLEDVDPNVGLLFEEIIQDSSTIEESMTTEVVKNIKKNLHQGYRTVINKIYESLKSGSACQTLTQSIRKNKEYASLLDTIQDLNIDLSLDTILKKILDASLIFLNAERGSVVLRKEDGSFSTSASRNTDKKDIPPFTIPKTVVQKISNEPKPIFIPDLVEEDDGMTSKSIMEMELRSIMCAPLIIHQETTKEFLGFIYLDSKNITERKGFTGDNLELLNLLANQAAVAIRNALLTEQLNDALDRKTNAEVEVRELNENLEEKVRQRTRELKEAQKELVENAYRMGMADIASEVLHNVGNVLSSVVISSKEIDEILKKSNITNLVKANDLLKNNLDNIQDFLYKDPKGKKLLDYYILLGDKLRSEQDTLLFHSQRLEGRTQVIRDIINTQQRYAGVKTKMEEIELNLAIDDAVKILENSFERHTIELKWDNASKRPFVIKGITFKLIHILVNILKNAKEAMGQTASQERWIAITIHSKKKQITVEIANSGEPILKENLTRIFNHGFTTKENGHGFGLHSSANYLQEMKGEIEVRSDGEKGATFTLTFPKMA